MVRYFCQEIISTFPDGLQLSDLDSSDNSEEDSFLNEPAYVSFFCFLLLII